MVVMVIVRVVKTQARRDQPEWVGVISIIRVTVPARIIGIIIIAVIVGINHTTAKQNEHSKCHYKLFHRAPPDEVLPLQYIPDE